MNSKLRKTGPAEAYPPSRPLAADQLFLPFLWRAGVGVGAWVGGGGGTLGFQSRGSRHVNSSFQESSAHEAWCGGLGSGGTTVQLKSAPLPRPCQRSWVAVLGAQAPEGGRPHLQVSRGGALPVRTFLREHLPLEKRWSSNSPPTSTPRGALWVCTEAVSVFSLIGQSVFGALPVPLLSAR